MFFTTTLNCLQALKGSEISNHELLDTFIDRFTVSWPFAARTKSSVLPSSWEFYDWWGQVWIIRQNMLVVLITPKKIVGWRNCVSVTRIQNPPPKKCLKWSSSFEKKTWLLVLWAVLLVTHRVETAAQFPGTKSCWKMCKWKSWVRFLFICEKSIYHWESHPVTACLLSNQSWIYN